MIYCTYHYNVISLDRLHSKTKIGKDQCYFNKKPKFSLTTKKIIFLIKNPKEPHSSASDWWEYIDSCFKENARAFSKNSINQENIRISRLKKRLWNFYNTDIFIRETKPMIENLQDDLYQLKNKPTKGTKHYTNIRWDLEGGKCSKTFLYILCW